MNSTLTSQVKANQKMVWYAATVGMHINISDQYGCFGPLKQIIWIHQVPNKHKHALIPLNRAFLVLS